MRWALRFWRDTRAMVSDVVGLARTNHGTIVARGLCSPNRTAAIRQQRDTSDDVKALNPGQETFAPISHTSVYTRTDALRDVRRPVLRPDGDPTMCPLRVSGPCAPHTVQR